MKKSHFTRNRYFWRKTDLNQFFYTSNCNEENTINNFFKRCPCNFFNRIVSLDFFVESAFISFFLGENDQLIDELIDNHKVSFEKKQKKITLFYYYYEAEDPCAEAFFEQDQTSQKHPDILMQIIDGGTEHKFIIDIKNRQKPKGVSEKYNGLCNSAFVFSICTGMTDDKYQWQVSSVPAQHSLPPVFLNLFSDIFEVDFGETYGENTYQFNDDRKYWISCSYKKKIRKTRGLWNHVKL
jgi:hypothetical protein